MKARAITDLHHLRYLEILLNCFHSGKGSSNFERIFNIPFRVIQGFRRLPILDENKSQLRILLLIG